MLGWCRLLLLLTCWPGRLPNAVGAYRQTPLPYKMLTQDAVVQVQVPHARELGY
eukprot:COSAG04_NODE_2106_length_4770_cov_6.166774_6_plen_54_part_00